MLGIIDQPQMIHGFSVNPGKFFFERTGYADQGGFIAEPGGKLDADR
jgi:hypothetical protein